MNYYLKLREAYDKREAFLSSYDLMVKITKDFFTGGLFIPSV